LLLRIGAQLAVSSSVIETKIVFKLFSTYSEFDCFFAVENNKLEVLEDKYLVNKATEDGLD